MDPSGVDATAENVSNSAEDAVCNQDDGGVATDADGGNCNHNDESFDAAENDGDVSEVELCDSEDEVLVLNINSDEEELQVVPQATPASEPPVEAKRVGADTSASTMLKTDKDASDKLRALSPTEELIYDRQIRLWGIEAQQRITSSRVLFVGKNGIQEEAIKNMVLAGMCVSVVNGHLVTEDDVSSSFFLRPEDVGKEHAPTLAFRMAPMTVAKDKIEGHLNRFLHESRNSDGRFYYDVEVEELKRFNALVVAAEDYPLHALDIVDGKCRQHSIAFFVTICNGTQGILFTDLNEHTIGESLSGKRVSLSLKYRSLHDVYNNPQVPPRSHLNVRNAVAFYKADYYGNNLEPEQLSKICANFEADEEAVKRIIAMRGRFYPMTCGILGGYLATEIRKFITRQHETLPNLCVFNVDNSCVAVANI